jgi:hypothetical protein
MVKSLVKKKYEKFHSKISYNIKIGKLITKTERLRGLVICFFLTTKTSLPNWISVALISAGSYAEPAV